MREGPDVRGSPDLSAGRRWRRRASVLVGLSVLVLVTGVVAAGGTSAVGAAVGPVESASGSPPVAAQVGADEHRLEITNDGSGRTDYEVSFDGIVGTEGFGPGDTVSGNTATGFVRGGTDTIVYTGDVTDFSYSGTEPTVRVDGVEVPVSSLAEDSDEEPAQRIAITNDGSGRTDYDLRVDELVGVEGFGPGDAVDGNAASGFVYGGTDAVRFRGEITSFEWSGVEPTVTVDGTEVSPSELGDGDASSLEPGEPVSEAGKGYPQSSTDSEVVEYQSGYRCLENPYRYADEGEYSYDEYHTFVPDRFVEDLLETEGVVAVLSVGTGAEGDAGLEELVLTEPGADPLVYCDANDGEGSIVLAETGGDWPNDRFTPYRSAHWADPTYEDDMVISDQAVDWLMGHDNVTAVEASRVRTTDGIETRVTVLVDQYPPAHPTHSLPDWIDGHRITYAEA